MSAATMVCSSCGMDVERCVVNTGRRAWVHAGTGRVWCSDARRAVPAGAVTRDVCPPAVTVDCDCEVTT